MRLNSATCLLALLLAGLFSCAFATSSNYGACKPLPPARHPIPFYPHGSHGPAHSCPPTDHNAPQLLRVSLGSSGQFVDEFGRIRIFHGLNVDSKTLPYNNEPNVLNSSFIETLAYDYGFNVMRLDFAMVMAMPAFGVDNTTYYSLYANTTNQFAAVGMWTIVDVHQDEVMPCICGEGLPDWLLTIPLADVGSFPYPAYNTTYPLDPTRPLGCVDQSFCEPDSSGTPRNNGQYYFSEVTQQALLSIYTNVNTSYGIGAGDAMVQQWTNIAAMTAGNPNYLAIELFNEPFPPVNDDPASFISAQYGDVVYLAPMYDAGAAGIRSQDSEILIMVEPLVTNGEIVPRPAGFLWTPAGDNQTVLSFHTYCDVIDYYCTDDSCVDQTDLEYCFFVSEYFPEYLDDCNAILADPLAYCNSFYNQSFAVRAADAASLGQGLFDTEFGSWTGNDTYDIEINQLVANLADQYGVSWAKWDNNDLDQRPALIPVLVRTYAQAIAAVAGSSFSQQFNPDSKLYSLVFSPDYLIQAPTEIFVPPMHYPYGFNVQISPVNALRWSQPYGSNTLQLTAGPRGRQSASVTVTITAKPAPHH